jgi:hypothetical protein
MLCCKSVWFWKALLRVYIFRKYIQNCLSIELFSDGFELHRQAVHSICVALLRFEILLTSTFSIQLGVLYKLDHSLKLQTNLQKPVQEIILCLHSLVLPPLT